MGKDCTRASKCVPLNSLVATEMMGEFLRLLDRCSGERSTQAAFYLLQSTINLTSWLDK
jgi:hypothetical protein